MAPISFFGIDWSPDGGKLVFVSGRDGDDDIYEGTLVNHPRLKPVGLSLPHDSPGG